MDEIPRQADVGKHQGCNLSLNPILPRWRFSRNQNNEGNEQTPQEVGNVQASGPVYLVYLVYFVGLVGRTGKSTRGTKENGQMSKEPWRHCLDS